MRRSTSVIFFLFILVASGLPGSRFVNAQDTVYTDTMDSAETGLLSTETFDPTISFAYQNSQFVVNVKQPAYKGDIVSTLSAPEMASSRLTVDAFIGGDPANKYVIAGCRHTDAGEGYFFGYLPATGDILIWRRDATGDTNIAQSVDASLIAPANTMYQIGIDCWTNVITGIVNGQPVVSAFDPTYTMGRPAIGVGANGLETDGLSVAFDNLTVTDKGNLALGPETPVGQEPVTTAQTAPIRDPQVDPAGTLADAFTISLNQEPMVSGLGGDPVLEVGGFQTLPAGVQLADFYTELHFIAPAVPADSSYLVGFCFWVEPDGSCYDIYLADDGSGEARWGYGYDPAVGDYQPLLSDSLPSGNIDPTPGAQNFLSLTVYQGTAILSGNNFDAAAVIPLQGTPLAGDIEQELSLLAHQGATVTESLPMSVSDFAVWDLSSGVVPVSDAATAVATESPLVPTVAALPTVAPTVASLPTTAAVVSGAPRIPPLTGGGALGSVFERGRTQALANAPLATGMSGVFTQEQDVYAFAPANVGIADFYAIVTFTNPSDLVTPVDVGIGFRAAQGSESGLRLVFWSEGSWFLQQPGQDASASGSAPSFDWSPGATNTIELLAMGPTGIVAVNGTIVSQLDLSSIAAPGDVYVGTGFFSGDTMPGRQVAYQEWWIYPTSILDVKSG